MGNDQLTRAKVYIYTIPKAGTYLMSQYFSELGMRSTGWHVFRDGYLDTHAFDDITNRSAPSKTKRNRCYLDSFRLVPPGSHSFGHFSPLYLPPSFIRQHNYKFVCIRRNPRQVLSSEFIDFRFRRNDVKLVSIDRIKDHEQAFCLYLQKHGPVIKEIFLNYMLLQRNVRMRAYLEMVGEERFLFLDFNDFLSSVTGPMRANDIARFMGTGMDTNSTERLWRSALKSDNKTKSVDLDIPFSRESLWTDRANKIFSSLRFVAIEKALGYL